MTAETYILVSKNHQPPHRVDVTYSTFPDGDTHCLIKDLPAIKDCDVLIVHSLYPAQNNQLIKLFLLLGLLHDEGVKSVNVCVPYLPYARQDRRHVSGEAVSIDTICRLLTSMGCAQLYTFDCHFMKGASTVTRNGLIIRNFSLGPLLISYCRRKIGHPGIDILSPDIGAQYLTGGDKSMHKKRGSYAALDSGDSYRHIAALKSDHIAIAHDTVVLVDDMISTGSTMLHAIENLRARGIKHIYCAVTHGLFIADCYEKLAALTEETIFSDTVSHINALPFVDVQLATQIIPNWLRK